MTSDAPRQRRPYAARMPIEQRRTELLDAALRLATREGYAALTAEAISREAGVTKPVLYGAFPSVPALLGSLLDRQQKVAVEQLMGAVPTSLGDNPATLAETITRAWVETVRTDPATWRLILATGPNTPAAVLDRIEEGRALVRAQLGFLLRLQLPARGPVDPHIAAHALIAVAEHFGRLLVTAPDEIDVDRLATTVQALVSSVLAGSRPASPGAATARRTPE